MMVIRSGGDSFVQLSTCLMLAARRSAVIHINTNTKKLYLGMRNHQPESLNKQMHSIAQRAWAGGSSAMCADQPLSGGAFWR